MRACESLEYEMCGYSQNQPHIVCNVSVCLQDLFVLRKKCGVGVHSVDAFERNVCACVWIVLQRTYERTKEESFVIDFY